MFCIVFCGLIFNLYINCKRLLQLCQAYSVIYLLKDHKYKANVSKALIIDRLLIIIELQFAGDRA